MQTARQLASVQIPGVAGVTDRAPLRETVRKRASISEILAAYEQFFIADVQQTDACNAAHLLDQRLSRWLLRISDLVGNDIELTQDSFAAMIGVSRTSVSLVASRLRDAGVIKYA